jgi:hypothetical protein
MEFLTEVQLLFEEKRRNAKLLFGNPLSGEDLCFSEGSSRKNVYFKPDSLFALELWAANAYGTMLWTVYIVRAVWPGEGRTGSHTLPLEPRSCCRLGGRGG